MRNITLSADAELIESARARARAERSTLNEQFRRWLADYTRRPSEEETVIAVIEDLQQRIRTGGRHFSRDEMNER
jgi:hypothetical protein